jgi:rod shape-determining protein MreD
MNAAKSAWFAFIFVLLVALHYTLRPVLAWRAPVDFLVIALLLVAVRARPGVAALAGFALGIMADSLTPGAFGAGALAMTLVGFGASWLKAAFFADNLVLNGIFVFLGKWTFDVVFLVAERRVQGMDLLTQVALWSPLSAAATAVAGLVVLLAVRPVLGAPRT